MGSIKCSNLKICVIGLGYIGLPLVVSLSKYFRVMGFDTSDKRVFEIQNGIDVTGEVSEKALKSSLFEVTDREDEIFNNNVYIIAVPTPVDLNNNPDLNPLRNSSTLVGNKIKKGDIVIYESTVYPGITENFCGQILEETSGLKKYRDFYLGYSPERINPGDKKHSLSNMVKVISADNEKTIGILREIYGKICDKVFQAKSIKVAEAAKVLENSQRDINIALINEVTVIFNKLGLSVYDVLEAAKTKWNFLDFVPGFVGGHCIGVDPYYLAKCAQDVGYEPKVLLSGRRTNEDMGEYIAERVHEGIQKNVSRVEDKIKILVLGMTFKEDVSDLRNTKVVDCIFSLLSKGYKVDVFDALADSVIAKKEYGIELLPSLCAEKKYDCIVVAVAHEHIKNITKIALNKLIKPKGVIADIKSVWDGDSLRERYVYFNL